MKKKTNPSIEIEKVYVLHVKKGYEDRDLHIRKMLGNMNIPFQYILDGDMTDLSIDSLSAYFRNDMLSITPATSCSMKHILAYQHMIDNHIQQALILEDDILLARDFIRKFNQSMHEKEVINKGGQMPITISYEDTRLRFIPRSQRIKGKCLYPGKCDRMTGAYYLNLEAACVIMDFAKKYQMDLPIDLTHNQLLKEKRLNYYWMQPTIATQGSHVGKFCSAINFQKSFITPTLWKIQRLYKKVLYFIR